MSTLENWNVAQQYPLLTPEDDDLVQIFRGPVTGKATIADLRDVADTGPTGPTGATGGTGPTGGTGATGPAVTLPALAALGGAYEVDLGPVSAVDCATLGPQTLLTLADGEMAKCLSAHANGFEFTDIGIVLIGVLDLITAVGEPTTMGRFDTDLIVADYIDASIDPGEFTTTGNIPRMVKGPVDLVAVYSTNGSLFVDRAPGVWQANHVYELGEIIIAPSPDPYFWYVTQAGTSGGSEPDWPASAQPTTDGTAQWSYMSQGTVPTTGACHFSVMVSKAVTP